MNAAARRILGCFAAIVLSTTAAPAVAQQYARGDLGWSTSRDAGIRDNNFDTQGIICGNTTCSEGGALSEIGSAYLAGIGIGTHITSQFRADITYTYRGGYELSQSDQRAPPQTFRSDIESHVAMASVYYDLPFRLGPVAPFVGAGIGFALNKTGEVELSSSLAPGAPTTLPGGSNTEFAWQAMAGVSVGLTRTMTLELGYRYVDLGAIEFDQGNQIQFGLPAGTTLGMNGNLSAHEVIASIRLGI